MSVSAILALILIALVTGVGGVLIGVLIEFSVRKKLPQRVAIPPPSEPATVSEVAPHPPPQAPVGAAAEARALQPEPVREARVPEPSAPAPVPPAVAPPAPAPRVGLGLRKTRENFLVRLRAAITGSAKLDDICEGLEEALIAADTGVEASSRLVAEVRTGLKGSVSPDRIRDLLKERIAVLLESARREPADSGETPLVIMLVGVNGVGKTTTVAKLAARLKAERGSVMVAAADTFRAAAIEQLEIWCNRVGADLIKHNQGSDPAAVAFDAVKAAVARRAGALLIDTAGRLQTKVNLMEELKKVVRVVARELPGAPHETWLVLDATTGQNALSQAKIFGDVVPLTGVVLAKLDSTARGGVILGIAERLKLPVRFVGVGEALEDLRPFDIHEFVEALFAAEETDARDTSGSYAA